uniref:H15 domain-containing protein n=1 Tax=Chelonoidis abingdonii TaxID=106734 RepID=A0A8C0HAW7_CHEAB
MSETAPVAAPAVSAPDAKAATKKPKKTTAGSEARNPSGPSVTELITKAVSASKERKGVSLAALKKALAAGGYDVEKSNSRIKVGLKSLVSKGTLVQTKGSGASGSFKLSKKPADSKGKASGKALETNCQDAVAWSWKCGGGGQEHKSCNCQESSQEPPPKSPKNPVKPYRLTDILEHELSWVNTHFIRCMKWKFPGAGIYMQARN